MARGPLMISGSRCSKRLLIENLPTDSRKVQDFAQDGQFLPCLLAQGNRNLLWKDRTMKRQGNCRMTMVWLGILVGILAGGGGRAEADFTFGVPTNLGSTINYKCQDGSASLSADGLSLFFESDYPDCGYWKIFVATRETTAAPWGDRVMLGPAVNTSNLNSWRPSISADGLELYFGRGDRAKGIQMDLWVTTRETTNDAWGTAMSLGETVNSVAHEDEPAISGDGLTLYFSSNRPGGLGGTDLWVTTRPTKQAAWGDPVNLGPTVNSSSDDFAPSVAADGLTLIFSSDRPGKYSTYYDLWATTRRTPTDAWREPSNLGPAINTGDVDYADLSPDGTTLYLTCFKRSGGYGWYDIWQTSIVPILDFNGDGIVDTDDLLTLIDRWGTSETLCDIGPMPWGDGKVDAADLKVLMSHWGQEVNDPTVAAHWTLDETEGVVAHDDAGGNNGTIIGLSQWRPQGGRIAGALELNGTTFVTTAKSGPSPADGPFSVLAWVKGGAPGQVILSQAGGANWLMAGTPDGTLRTELKAARGGPLVSSGAITDGNWHRVGLVWDGSNRVLYVDGVEVAKDTQVGVAASAGGLYIGAGSTLAPSSFWRGLIDDVRIYDRAVKP
jgi:hypothetical protein